MGVAGMLVIVGIAKRMHLHSQVKKGFTDM
jgi:hypothetical protein